MPGHPPRARAASVPAPLTTARTDGGAPATAPRRPSRPSRRLFAFDRRLGEALVAGADEAGRGCLAGPLVVAAVCLDLGAMPPSARRALADLDDSKRLAPVVRQRLAHVILRVSRQVVVVSASAATIDRDGLHRTNLRLLCEAIAALDPAPGACLIDGFRLGPAAPPHRAVTGGDRTSACVAAASVVAKVTRDRFMCGAAHAAHPGYGFDSHVGYATPAHRRAIRALGPSPLHRRSFNSMAFAEYRAAVEDDPFVPAADPPPGPGPGERAGPGGAATAR